MLEPLVPDAKQAAAIWRMVNEPTRASLNTSELGRGKTLMALETAKGIGAESLFVIAPLGTLTGWKHTALRQGIDLPFHWIKNDKHRDEILASLKANQPGIYFIGIEYFRQLGWVRKPVLDGRGNQRTSAKTGKPMWNKERDKLWRLVHPDFIAVDESHKAANRRSDTYKTLNLQTGDNFLTGGYKHAMSATPYGNGFDGAWSVPRWLWPDDDIVPRSYELWVGRWAKTEYDPFSYTHRKVIGELNPGAWFDSLPCHIHLEAKPRVIVFEEPEHRDENVMYGIDEEIFLDLTPKQRRIYDELEKQKLAWLGDNPLVVDLPITQNIRQHQVTLAEPIINEDGEVDFAENAKSIKTDTALDIIRNEIDEESALIFSSSQKFNAKVLVPRLIKAGYSAELYDGSLSAAKKEAAKERFMNGETKYLVSVIAAGGTGIDGFQHATRNVIWMNKDLNGVNNEQASGRVPRQGQTKTVRQFFLIAVDTKDEKSYISLSEKEIARRRSLKGAV